MSQSPDPRSTYKPAPELLHPRPDTIAELANMRFHDLVSLSDRLSRVAEPTDTTPWSSAGWACVGGAISSVWGLIAFLSTDADGWLIAVSICVLIGFILGSIGCLRAAKDVDGVRAESAAAIKTDLDKMLARYEHENSARSR